MLALQGAAWMIVYALRKRTWIAVVSALWFADGVTMAIVFYPDRDQVVDDFALHSHFPSVAAEFHCIRENI